MKYQVKNFSSNRGDRLQEKIQEWAESREHITISFFNIWVSDGKHHCTIIYTENQYIG